ncbi:MULTISPECIES: TonB family protein [unclassified Bradyrhizobium]|uniref:energy transducer TonB n=1 Tax=unclassified Bradyrhizobium TaxID=2631580 RepID=UPI0024E09E37|nr:MULTISPECIES: TonB family protein [unclassified Bradyrhizobium]
MQGTAGLLRGLVALTMLSLVPTMAAADGAKDDWIKSLVAALKAHRRYPPEATDQGGSAKVVFRIDGSGHLISAALIESTGDPALDQEALAMVERTQPFPPPPPDLPEHDLTLLLPVVFAPRRTSGIMTFEETRLQFEETKPNDAALKARLNGVCRGC